MKRTKILKELIEDTGMNMKAFARKANIPYTTLRSMLSRGIGNASVDNVIKVCQALDITVDELQNMAKEGKQKRPTTIAAHLDGVELSEQERKELNNFIQFLLSKRKK